MRSLVLVVASLAVGFGLGYVTRAPDTRGRTARDAAPAAAPRRETARPAKATLAKALQEIPAPPIATGDGVITGKVQTPQGDPVAGVTVEARAEGEGIVGDIFGEKEPLSEDEVVRRFVHWYRTSWTPRAKTVTDKDGIFALERLADGKYHLTAECEGYEVSDNTFEGHRPGASVTLVAHQLVEIRVDVVWPDGTRPERAQIESSSDQDFTSYTRDWTPEAAVVRLPAGAQKIKALCNGAESKEVTVQLEAGKTHEARLELLARIEG